MKSKTLYAILLCFVVGVVQGAPITKKQAIAKARQQVDGQVLKATLKADRQPPVYHVKILKADGRVKTVTVPAN